MESNNMSEDIALFKYGIIIPLINNSGTWKSDMEFFNAQSEKEYLHPNGKKVSYAANTIKGWYLDYRANGFEGLKPIERRDKNSIRGLDSMTIQRIIELKNEQPRMKCTTIQEKLINEGLITRHSPSLSTIQRTVRLYAANIVSKEKEERFAYEMEYANDCFIFDTSYTMYINDGKKKRRTYLIVGIDDASRVIVGAEFFYEDNALNVQKVFKDSIKMFGLCKKKFVDNGTPYRNHQLNLICAKLGVQLIHSRIYSGASKAKVERFFKSIKDAWLEVCDHSQYTSIVQLNKELKVWINDYNHRVHSGIKMKPIDRWNEDREHIKYLSPDVIDECFLHQYTRKVNNDATISVDNELYEVPQRYTRQKIDIVYDPTVTPKQIYLLDNKVKIPIKKLNKVENSKIKRTINFSKSTSKGDK